MNVHEGANKEVACNFCEKKFTLRRLKRHIKGVHEKTKDNLCKICNKFFSDEWISNHIKTVHEKIKNSGKWEFCEKSFCKSYYLKLHIKKVHENILEYACNLCNKTYSDSTTLKTSVH